MTTTLESLIFDELNIVTALILSRRADITVSEAVEQMKELYEKRKGEENLWAVFAVTGQTEKHGVPCSATVLIREQELSEKKEELASVQSVELYSLQTCEIENLYAIYLAEQMDREDFFRTDNERAAIKATKVDECREKMIATLGETAMKKLVSPVKAKPTTTSKPAVKKNAPKGLEKAFERACVREKTPKNSPLKVARDSPFSSEKKSPMNAEDSNSPVIVRKRARKILIDDESPVKLESPLVKNETPDCEVEAPKAKVAAKKKIDTKLIADVKHETPDHDNDDLFDAADEQPEIEKNTENFKKEKKPTKDTKVKTSKDTKVKTSKDTKVKTSIPKTPVEPLRRSPRKNIAMASTDDSGEPKKRKVMKKVAEQFEDDDGFLVTKDVLREVEIEEEHDKGEENKKQEPLSKMFPKKEEETGKTMKMKKASEPVAQSKISSFFKKK